MMHSCRWDFNRLRPQRVEGASIHVAWDYNSTTNKLNRLYDDNRDGRATRTPRHFVYLGEREENVLGSVVGSATHNIIIARHPSHEK